MSVKISCQGLTVAPAAANPQVPLIKLTGELHVLARNQPIAGASGGRRLPIPRVCTQQAGHSLGWIGLQTGLRRMGR